jgi:hypothetical protein
MRLSKQGLFYYGDYTMLVIFGKLFLMKLYRNIVKLCPQGMGRRLNQRSLAG